LLIHLTACGSKKVIYNEGTFEGEGEGHIGPIKIQVVTDKYKIKDIKVLEHEETPVIDTIASKKIFEKVIKSNSSDVDVVTGATYTSKGYITAIKDALKKAQALNKNNSK
jgi:uncharacterized protein with FMN-binding domain